MLELYYANGKSEMARGCTCANEIVETGAGKLDRITLKLKYVNNKIR